MKKYNAKGAAIKALKREVKELRRANEILKPTGTCFCSDGA